MIKELDNRVAELIDQSEIGKRLLSIKGFGITSCGELAGEIGSIDRFQKESSLALYIGIEIAKADGKYKGRKPVNEAKLQQVQQLVDNGTSVSKAVSEVGISRRTYYKATEDGRI